MLVKVSAIKKFTHRFFIVRSSAKFENIMLQLHMHISLFKV